VLSSRLFLPSVLRSLLLNGNDIITNLAMVRLVLGTFTPQRSFFFACSFQKNYFSDFRFKFFVKDHNATIISIVCMVW
jgi:hypothetical protein